MGSPQVSFAGARTKARKRKMARKLLKGEIPRKF
jgi:hypothetical protein